MSKTRFITNVKATCASDCEHAGEPCLMPPPPAPDRKAKQIFGMLHADRATHAINYTCVLSVVRVVNAPTARDLTKCYIVPTDRVCDDCGALHVDLVTHEHVVHLCGAPVCHKRRLAFDITKSTLESSEERASPTVAVTSTLSPLSHEGKCTHDNEEIPIIANHPSNDASMAEASAVLREHSEYAQCSWTFCMCAVMPADVVSLLSDVAIGDCGEANVILLVQNHQCEFCRGYVSQAILLPRGRADPQAGVFDQCCKFFCTRGRVSVTSTLQCTGPLAAAAAKPAASVPRRPEKECCICMDELTADFVVLVPCGHTNICRACAQQRKREHKTCPMCSRTIRKVTKIFFE